MMTRHTTTHGINRRAPAGAGDALRVEDMSILATLMVCCALTLAIALATYVTDLKAPFSLPYSTTSVPAQVPPAMPPFRLSGIQLGMTPVEIASVHPEILIADHPPLGIEGKFKIGFGTYKVKFLGPHWGKQAYQISYGETFWNYSEVELRHRLKQKFGQPTVNRCRLENPRKGLQCHLQWRRADGVILKADTETINVATGGGKSHLQFVALDPRLESRLIRKVEKYQVKPVKKFFSQRMSEISAAARGR
jgi:hypothetical protein